MAISFFMDQHVPAAISRGLRLRGIDVLTAYEDSADRLPDEELLQRATSTGRILVTQDDDLLEIGNRWMREGREFAGIVYFHQLNITIGKAIDDIELLARCCNNAEFRSQIQFLPLR